MSDVLKKRYERQMMMPAVSDAGQAKLENAHVLIAGSGGLGSISAYYMAAAGVGRIRLVDRDRVELSNLNRQIIHGTSDIGRWKVNSAQDKLSDLNPDCKVEAIRQEIEADNVMELVNGCDVILDATDNLGARKLLNRAALALKIPFIYGGIKGFGGMVSTFRPPNTACLECLFPDDLNTPQDPVGVIGPTAGLVASLQSLEAIKYILELEPLLENRLLRIDAVSMSFKTTRLVKNNACHICGKGGK